MRFIPELYVKKIKDGYYVIHKFIDGEEMIMIYKKFKTPSGAIKAINKLKKLQGQ